MFFSGFDAHMMECPFFGINSYSCGEELRSSKRVVLDMTEIDLRSITLMICFKTNKGFAM